MPACRRIEESFAAEADLRSFRESLAVAAERVGLPSDEPGEEAHFASAKLVVDRPDLLIAVWDGTPARGLGGTGDVAWYSVESRKPVVRIDPASRLIGGSRTL